MVFPDFKNNMWAPNCGSLPVYNPVPIQTVAGGRAWFDLVLRSPTAAPAADPHLHCGSTDAPEHLSPLQASQPSFLPHHRPSGRARAGVPWTVVWGSLEVLLYVWLE